MCLLRGGGGLSLSLPHRWIDLRGRVGLVDAGRLHSLLGWSATPVPADGLPPSHRTFSLSGRPGDGRGAGWCLRVVALCTPRVAELLLLSFGSPPVSFCTKKNDYFGQLFILLVVFLLGTFWRIPVCFVLAKATGAADPHAHNAACGHRAKGC